MTNLSRQKYWVPSIFRRVPCCFVPIALLLFGGSCLRMQRPTLPPETPRDNVVDTLHGVEVADPYRRLEDQQAAATRAWIDAQNGYTRSVLRSLKGRRRLEKRLTELMRVEVVTPPTVRRGRYFFSKRRADQEQMILYMREGLDGEDRVLIDPHGMSPDQTTSVRLMDVSADGTLLAYSVQQGGEDESVVHFLDVDRRADLSDELPKARYSDVSLLPDRSGLYYAIHTDDGPRVRFHATGTKPADDKEIFGKGYGREKWIWATLSEDGRHLLLHVEHSWSKADVFYKNVREDSPVISLVEGIDAQFSAEAAGDRIYVRTNWEASNGRILAVQIQDLPRPPTAWREIIPATDAVIESFSAVGGKLLVTYLKNVVSHLCIFDAEGKYLRDVAFPVMGEIEGAWGRWSDREAFFSYSSFLIPYTIYRYDVETGDRHVWAKLDIPIRADDAEVKQVWYASKDGTRIPMFLVHKKGLRLDGSNPVYLTGYGGFNASLTPGFSALAALWVEYGGVFARPNLRGGGEFGETWHKAGMFENKQNVFDDFLAAAEWLIENRYANPQKLAIAGGSNGGLLVGAALTQRPDLFRAVVCAYPLLDMVRYHKFLLGPLWIGEYGSAENPEQFKYLHAYSPYHNVRDGTLYPAVLFVTGDSDTRVAPLHARKMAALLQAETGSDHPVLLLYDTRTGHSGGMPIRKQIEDTTDSMSFVLWQLGVLKD